MPTFSITGRRISYATEEATLAFANAIRGVGGADVIEAFFPSRPGAARKCLIANALNFGCSVKSAVAPRRYNGEFDHWRMVLPYNVRRARAQAIADAVGCELVVGRPYEIVLPRLIGNAAHAFDDAERGWTRKYAIADEES